jgi:hypothetical protein
MGWRSRSDGVHLAIATLACAAFACNALIGTKDIFFDNSDGGSPSGDASGSGGVDTGVPPGGDSATPTDSPSSSSGDSGPCNNTQNDPANCGRCGHSCLGGACTAGQCQPVALATNVSPRAIAVDKSHVYWIEPQTARAMQADKDGSNQIQLGGGTNNYLTGLAVDDANVFWGTRDELVLRCKIGGCANTPTVVTGAIVLMGDVAVDATNVYWLEIPSGPARVKSAPKGASNTTAVTQIALDTALGNAYNHIAADGQFVYWTADDGKVRRVAPTGGTVTVVASATGNAGGLAVDDQNVYFTAGDDPGTVNIAPKGGSSGGNGLAASQHLPVAVAVDQNSAYWVNALIGTSPNSGTVMTCHIASCTPTPIATAQHGPVAIAVDDVAVYWSNYDLGSAAWSSRSASGRASSRSPQPRAAWASFSADVSRALCAVRWTGASSSRTSTRWPSSRCPSWSSRPSSPAPSW